MAANGFHPTVERMTLWQRIEHAALMICVLLLVLSGLALSYHATVLGRFLIACMGGPQGRFLIHRGAALGLLAVLAAQAIALAISARVRQDFRESLPTTEDLKDIRARFVYHLTGKGPAPRYGRYTPMQKFQYWGIGLGSLMMAVSGLVLWFKAQALGAIPKAAFDMMLVIHSSEAQLIFVLFILWHLYDVHLAGGNFPMNPAWLTGRMPEESFRKQHEAEWEALQKERPE